ncbi:N-acetyltransferase [Rhodococcus spelaei]|uniref:N-acetyltransferase n=1 Tax=Rhodococcus spelaei TaxID=2546320 RepID=A0A541BAV0_9NOCA|nr:N-acetyltransferase [Rhodococcus spelaei]TQF69446.1 N-acetyltransferase [Rhodococcus spelaei]
MLIRREHPTDVDAIAAVHRSAFADQYPPRTEPMEVGLVDTLRASDAWLPTLSLVAETDGAVVGHVCLTRATLDGRPVLALGPIGVPTERHGAGIGSALMHAVLGAADALDEPLVALLGHLDYYPRFGFVPAATLSIDPGVPDWVEHFQVRTLEAYTPELVGEFRYPQPFYDL